jgi:hypothetical protein
MHAELKRSGRTSPSEFLNLKGIEYFMFEEDFMENNIRCIPMIIRFKMDKAGIKLKLSEWNRLSIEEKILLAKLKCNSGEEIERYNKYLKGLIKERTGREATILEVDQNPLWENVSSLPEKLNEILAEFDWQLSIEQWKDLTCLQRFALLKLCRPGHENKNFPKAMKEFKLLN